jgi:hypothetical protein
VAATQIPGDHVSEVALIYCTMKNKFLKRLAFTAILIIMILSGTESIIAQVRVSKITGPEMLSGKKGIVYTLPRTQIHVDLWLSRTEQFSGPLAEFAGEYLGLDDVITKSSVNYAVENAAIFSSAEADPNQVYLIEKEEKSSGEIWISFGKSTPLLTLEKFDKTISPQGFVNWNKDLFLAPDPGYLFKKYTESLAREIIDTVIRRVSIDTLVLEEKIFRRSMVEFTDREKAQEAAEKIRKIEQDKYNLLVGYQETAYSQGALEFMYNTLEEQRLEYMKLFTGVSVKETLRFKYQFFPDPEKEKQEYSLAAFLESSGMTAPDGENDIMISLQPDDKKMVPGKTTADQPPTGFVYRIAQPVQAVLSVQGKELDSKRLEIMQFGAIQSLPPEFKRVEFDLETGALKSVVIE